MPHFHRRMGGSEACLGLADKGGRLCVQSIPSLQKRDYLCGSIKLFRAGGNNSIGYVVLPKTLRQFFEARVALVSHDYNLERRREVEVQRR